MKGNAADCHMLLMKDESASLPAYVHFGCLSLHHEGVLGIGHLVLSLFRRCITFCKECKLCSRWNWLRYRWNDQWSWLIAWVPLFSQRCTLVNKPSPSTETLISRNAKGVLCTTNPQILIVIYCIHLHIHHMSRISFIILSFLDFVVCVVTALIFH